MSIPFFGSRFTQKPFLYSSVAKLMGLVLISLLIYYPLLHAQYLYTDEASQIWYGREGINQTSLSQGRYITYFIFTTLFRFFDKVNDVRIARVISLSSWIFCFPVWYYVFTKLMVVCRQPLNEVMLALVYMVCMPAFAITVCWAACLEMSFACTTGLISGYLFYRAFSSSPEAKPKREWLVICSAIMGLLSLFTYQNAFGCFFICFFIQFVRGKKITSGVLYCFAFSLLVYLIYFISFKATLNAFQVTISDRSSLAVNPMEKLFFLLTRPLATSNHLTFLFDDKSLLGLSIYVLLASGWFLVTLLQLRASKNNAFFFYLGILVFLLLAYLPSLIVSENYPSHRTLFALNMLVFFMLFDVLLRSSLLIKWKRTIISISMILFICNAWYNVRYEFVYPLKAEYAFIQSTLKKKYSAKIDAIHIITLQENSFSNEYGIVRSYDEFGIASTAKKWTAEPLVKQLIYEITLRRNVADSTIITTWKSYNEFEKSHTSISSHELLIDVRGMFENHLSKK